MGETGRDEPMQKRRGKRGQRKDEPSRLTPKNTAKWVTSHTARSFQPLFSFLNATFLVLDSPVSLSISQSSWTREVGSGEKVRLPQNNRGAEITELRAQSATCCEQVRMSNAENI